MRDHRFSRSARWVFFCPEQPIDISTYFPRMAKAGEISPNLGVTTFASETFGNLQSF
jgi:hypothetical protein